MGEALLAMVVFSGALTKYTFYMLYDRKFKVLIVINIITKLFKVIRRARKCLGVNKLVDKMM